MAIQYSVELRDARNDQIETVGAASPILKLRTGAQPATCATADSGTVCATMALPVDWMAASASGVKAKSGTWQDPAADAAGTIAHFRIYKADGVTCVMQGSVTIAGGGGDMTLDNNVVAINQQITITAFSVTAGNA